MPVPQAGIATGLRLSEKCLGEFGLLGLAENSDEQFQ